MKESTQPIREIIRQLVRKGERKHLKLLFAEHRASEVGIDWYRYRSKNGKALDVLDRFVPGYLDQASGGRFSLSFLALILLHNKESLVVEGRCRRIFVVLKKNYEESHSSGIRIPDVRRATGYGEHDIFEAVDFLRRSGISLGALGSGRFDASTILMPSEQFLKIKSYDGLRRETLRWEVLRRKPGFPSLSRNTFQSADHNLLTEGWKKAEARLPHDPAGAITTARAELESELKRILDDMGVRHDDETLPALYRLVAGRLSLAPEKSADDAIKQILGGCVSIVQGLAAMRNRMGDAHGRGRLGVTPAVRHGELAVTCAKAVATFLVATKDAASGP